MYEWLQIYLALEYCANGNMRSYLLKHHKEFERALVIHEQNDSMQTMIPVIDDNIHDMEMLILWCYQVSVTRIVQNTV